MSEAATPSASAPSTPSAPAATLAAVTPASGTAAPAAAKPAQQGQGATPASVSHAAATSPATPAVGEGAKPATPGAEAAKQASAPAAADPPKPAEPAKDEVAETMARLNKEAREVAKAKKALEASQKELGDKVKLAEVVTSAREALGKKDFLGALTALAGEAGLDPDEAAVLLLEQANAREKPALTEKDIERIAEEKLKAKEAAERKAAEERGKAELDQGKQVYGNACAQVYKADPSNFPLISVYKVNDEDLFGWVIPETMRNRGDVPHPEKALEHFEAQHLGQFEKGAKALDGKGRFEKIANALGYFKTAQAQSGPAVSGKTDPAKAAPTAPVADTGGAVITEKPKEKPKRETIAEYNARVKAQFKARRGQAA